MMLKIENLSKTYGDTDAVIGDNTAKGLGNVRDL